MEDPSDDDVVMQPVVDLTMTQPAVDLASDATGG